MQSTMRVSEDRLGRRVRCRSCGSAILVDDDPVIDEATYDAPPARPSRRSRRNRSRENSAGPILWILGGSVVGVGLLAGCIVGVVLLVRSMPGIASAGGAGGAFGSGSWVNVALPEGISFSSPGQLTQLTSSPVPNGKAYGYESPENGVAVLSMTIPPDLGANPTEILERFQSNLRQQDSQISMRQLQVDGQSVVEVEKPDQKANIRGWLRIAVLGDKIVALVVLNRYDNQSTKVRDRVFQSMRIPGSNGVTAIAGVNQASSGGAQPGSTGPGFGNFGSFFGAPPSTPSTSSRPMPSATIPGMAGGPPVMPTMPNLPSGPSALIPSGPGQMPGGTFPAGVSPPAGMPGIPGGLPGGMPGGASSPIGAMPNGPAGIPGGMPGGMPGARPGGLPGGAGGIPGANPNRPGGIPGGMRPRGLPRR